jgi:hypothetical protein
MASWFLYQWVQLEWPIPDYVMATDRLDQEGRHLSMLLHEVSGTVEKPLWIGWRFGMPLPYAPDKVILWIDRASRPSRVRRTLRELRYVDFKLILQLRFFD